VRESAGRNAGGTGATVYTLGGTPYKLYGATVAEASRELSVEKKLLSRQAVYFIRGILTLKDSELIQDGDQALISEYPNFTQFRTHKQRECILKFFKAVQENVAPLDLSILGNHAIKITKSGDIKLEESYDENRFLDIFNIETADTEELTEKKNLCRNTDAYKVLVKEFIAIDILYYSAIPGVQIQDSEFNDLIETIGHLPKGIVEDPKNFINFLSIVDALMKQEPIIEDGNRAMNFRKLIETIVHLPEGIVENPKNFKNFLRIVDALIMEHKPIKKDGNRPMNFRKLIKTIGRLPKGIVEDPENFLSIVVALMKHEPIIEDGNRAMNFIKLIETIVHLPEGIVENPKNFLSIVAALMKHEPIKEDGNRAMNFIKLIKDISQKK
jgi:hypothetical protein